MSGLKARGGFEVNIEWSDNSIRKATIKSEKGGLLTVRSATPLNRKGKKSEAYYLYTFNTKKGQTITLNAK